MPLLFTYNINTFSHGQAQIYVPEKSFLCFCKSLYFLFELSHEKTCSIPYANNKGADQPMMICLWSGPLGFNHWILLLQLFRVGLLLSICLVSSQ